MDTRKLLTASLAVATLTACSGGGITPPDPHPVASWTTPSPLAVVADGQPVSVSYTCGTGTTCQVGALPSGITVSLSNGTGTLTAAAGTTPGTYSIVLNGTMPGQKPATSTLSIAVETPKHPAIAYASGTSTFLRQQVTLTPTVFADLNGASCTAQLLGDDLAGYGVKYIYADTARIGPSGTLTYVASNTPFRTAGFRDVKVTCTTTQAGRTLSAETTVRIFTNVPVITGAVVSGKLCANGNTTQIYAETANKEFIVPNNPDGSGSHGTMAIPDESASNTPPPSVVSVAMQPADAANPDRLVLSTRGAIPAGHTSWVLRLSNDPTRWQISVPLTVDTTPSCGT